MAERTEEERKLERARQTYAEVLDATKHQDDKINRFLAAIAFLTTGAIAFLFSTDVLSVHHQIGSRQIPLIAIFAGLYLVLTVAAVTLLMLSLSAELRLPGRRSPSWDKVSLDRSYLYFSMIADRPVGPWMTEWDQPIDRLEHELRFQYTSEAHNLAERARVKYGRTDEAAALFILALMFLAVGFLLAAFALAANVTGGRVQHISWNGSAAAIIGVVLAAHSFILLYNAYRHEDSAGRLWWNERRRIAGERKRDNREYRLHLGLQIRLLAIPSFVALSAALSVIHGNARTIIGIFLLISSAGGFLAVVIRWVPNSGGDIDDWLGEALPALDAVLLVGGAIVLLLVRDPLAPIIVALYPPVALSLLTLLRQTFDARRQRRKVRRAAGSEHRERVDEMTAPWTPHAAPDPSRAHGRAARGVDRAETRILSVPWGTLMFVRRSAGHPLPVRDEDR